MGLDGGVGFGAFDTRMEWSMMDSGGHAVFGRVIADLDRTEVEWSGRYYQSEYDNPYNRARAQRDEFFGLTARDEAGSRMSVVSKITREWTVKSHLDVWQRLVAETWNLEYQVRSDWDITKKIRWGTWLKINDKDLSTSGRSETYGESVEYDYDYELSGLYVSDYDDLSVSDVGSGMKVDWGNESPPRLSR